MEATAMVQLPIFWGAPIVGAVLGAIIYRLIVSGAAPAESKTAERVEYRETEYRPAEREYRGADRGEYRDYRDEYRDEYRDDRY